MKFRWSLAPPQPLLAEQLASQLGLSPLLAAHRRIARSGICICSAAWALRLPAFLRYEGPLGRGAWRG